MATVDDLARQAEAGGVGDAGSVPGGDTDGAGAGESAGSVLTGAASFVGKLLTAETGPGSVEAYEDHPLNLGRSPAVAQVLRGFTGWASVFGVESLRLAVVDVIAGFIRFRAPKPPAA